MKKVLGFLALGIAIIALVVMVRTHTYFENLQVKVDTPVEPVQLDEERAVARFAKAIQFPTISYEDSDMQDNSAFLQLHQHIETSFPLVHQYATLTKVSEFSLVYHLPGSEPSLKPALFMGHMDVVPIDEATLDQWHQGPFSGVVQDGVIWGRGAMDDKVSVFALLEAMELMLAHGQQPKRSIYYAFGHDEEIGGKQGAAKVAEHFRSQNIEFEFVLDEGGAITQGLMAGVEQPVAIIGIAEKGYVNLRLTVNAAGGHSSQPPNHTAAGILSQAIVKIEANPFPTNLEFSQQTFEYVGAYTPFTIRMAMSNMWLFKPLVENMMLSSASSAASIRTTTAATMLKGSSKSNILPTQATAVVNFRILPGDNIDYIKQRIIDVVDDPRVEIEAFMGNEPSVVSTTDSYGYKLIEQTIRGLDQTLLVAPYLVQGGTDAKHFTGLSDSIYRFMMVRLDQTTIKQFHGINEQIPVEDYIRAVQFFYAVLVETAQGDTGSE